jgi:hypothetical protein
MKHQQQQYVGYWQATTTSPLTSLGSSSRWGPIINWLTYQASITRYQIMSSPLLTHFQDTISLQPRNDKCISKLKQEIVTHLANPLRQLRKDCRSCRSSSCALMLACHSGLQFTQFSCHKFLSPSNITYPGPSMCSLPWSPKHYRNWLIEVLPNSVSISLKVNLSWKV